MGFAGRLRQSVEALTLVHGLDQSTVIDELGQQSGDTLDGQALAGRATLDHIGGLVLDAILKPAQNLGLDAGILGLLGGGLTLGRVLLIKQSQLMLNKLHHHGVGLDLGKGQQGVEAVTLRGLTVGSSHCINSFHFYFKGLPTLDYVFIIPHFLVAVKRFSKLFLFFILDTL